MDSQMPIETQQEESSQMPPMEMLAGDEWKVCEKKIEEIVRQYATKERNDDEDATVRTSRAVPDPRARVEGVDAARR